ncbi:holo-ACP synthase [Virgibacillus phasianinus]|uniref:Holo-[acyl-carrier-protein] synthase n=1 Tax=Virgibacillus phasianinus TaxID=2017483 RepID=A0A220U008_9BACI|nr:holo-ACP synthase [Virgibacillus phasianinus]ASK61256.1 holo-ACP synthase [Virgibacillus phasianinus]
MIKGIGIDIIELERIRNSLAKSNQLVSRILTTTEQIMYEKLSSASRRTEFLAGRFTAKEAFAKATGQGIGKLSFKDIEIKTNELGAPRITARGYEPYSIFISITHSKDYAVAQVIIEE